METAPAELLGLVAREDPVGVVLIAIELPAKCAQQLDLLLERLRLEARPRHEWEEMIDARIDRRLQQRGVRRFVAADDEAIGLDPVRRSRYSHSIVAGGFEVTSRTTRFTAGISLMIRDETSSIRSYGSRAQSAVIASSDVTARIAIG